VGWGGVAQLCMLPATGHCLPAAPPPPARTAAPSRPQPPPRTCVTTPAQGAQTAVSIFIALITASCWPACTPWPGLTDTSMTLPAMGAPTLPSTLGSAWGWEWGVGGGG
jgi:hypothetical protein